MGGCNGKCSRLYLLKQQVYAAPKSKPFLSALILNKVAQPSVHMGDTFYFLIWNVPAITTEVRITFEKLHH